MNFDIIDHVDMIDGILVRNLFIAKKYEIPAFCLKNLRF